MDRNRQADAYLKIADAALRVGAHDEAERWYRRALKLDPINPRAVAGLDAVRQQRRLRRWLVPVGSFLLLALALMGVWTLSRRPATGMEGLRPTAGAAQATAPGTTTPAPSAEEAVREALRGLAQSLAYNDPTALAGAVQVLTPVPETAEETTTPDDPWLEAAVHLMGALEACQDRRWNAAVAALAAVPELPDQAQVDRRIACFLLLLRAGEAGVGQYIAASFSQPDHLRRAAIHFAQARQVSETLPPGDWEARLAQGGLLFFEDFNASLSDMRKTWLGLPPDGADLLDGQGNLRWRAGGLFSQAGRAWRDYTLVVRLRPEEKGQVGLAARVRSPAETCIAWLPVGAESGETGSWSLACPGLADPPPEGVSAPAPCRLVAGQWQVVAITVLRHQAALTCGGATYGTTLPPEAPPTGGVGLLVQGTTALVDYVAVVPPLALPSAP